MVEQGNPGLALFFINDGRNGDSFQGVPGSKADRDNFQGIFEYGLGFRWVNKDSLNRNLSLVQWDHNYGENRQSTSARPEQCCVLCLLKNLDFTGEQYLVIGISTHGADIDGRAGVKLFDGNFLFVDDIMYALSDRNIPGLKGKKRILVVNSCRGNHDNAQKAADRGVSINVATAVHGNQPMETDHDDRHTQPIATPKGSNPRPQLRRQMSWTRLPTSNIPQLSDFLIVYAAPPGRSAKTHSIKGSWMLDALREIVLAYEPGQRVNLLQVMTRANHIMSQRESFGRFPDGTINPATSGEKNCMFFSSTLTGLPIFIRPPDRMQTQDEAAGGMQDSSDLPEPASFYDTARGATVCHPSQDETSTKSIE